MYSSVFVALAMAVAAQAQTSATPSGIAGISTCIVTCTAQAAVANGCTSVTDLTCVCTNTAFQEAAQTCLEASCTAEEQATALQLQTDQCASFSSAVSSASDVASSLSASVSSASESLTATATATATPTESTQGALSSIIAGGSDALSSAVASITSGAGDTSGASTQLGGGGAVVVSVAALGAIVGGLLVL